MQRCIIRNNSNVLYSQQLKLFVYKTEIEGSKAMSQKKKPEEKKKSINVRCRLDEYEFLLRESRRLGMSSLSGFLKSSAYRVINLSHQGLQ